MTPDPPQIPTPEDAPPADGDRLAIEPGLEITAEAPPEADVTLEPEPEPEAGPARFEVRAFWMPKRGNAESEWEDGFAFDPSRGILALADGASDGVFTRLWVRLLLDDYLLDPVPLGDPAAVAPWIAAGRRRWLDAIDYPSLRWSLQRKVDRSCAAATFLGVQVDPPDTDGSAAWTAWAVGDVCLFHVRDGALIDGFPVGSSSEFGMTPALFQSRAMRPLPVPAERRGVLLPGDLLVGATDAVACRLLSAVEQGEPPDWSSFWDAEPDAWKARIEEDRDAGRIVNDDCTLVLLRLADAGAGAVEAGDEPGHSEGDALA